ncbi:MAG: hypothetical protein RIB84_00590 [Sneathiellaceae bacterium]
MVRSFILLYTLALSAGAPVAKVLGIDWPTPPERSVEMLRMLITSSPAMTVHDAVAYAARNHDLGRNPAWVIELRYRNKYGDS